MKEYKKDTPCIKCGSDKINDVYREKCEWNTTQWRMGNLRLEEEHIERNCENCHYCWAEKPLTQEASDA